MKTLLRLPYVRLNVLWALCLFIALAFIVSCKEKKEATEVLVAQPAADACPCGSNWFPHSQTPAPLEGKGSPFDTNNTTVCMFHQWSWQKFLWLTKPLPSGNALFQDSMIQVDNHIIPVAPVDGVKLVLEDSTQAASAGILKSNPSFGQDGKSHTVYYAIFANQTLKQAADKFSALIQKDPTLVNNKFTFPVGSLELKASWIDVSALSAAEASSYYTADAIVMPGNKKIKAALLGLHVVGVVINHPEFVWATFEHHDMAPYYDWKATTTADVPVTSTTDKLFFAKGATATYSNLQYTGASPSNVFTIYKYGIPLIAQDSFMTTSQTEPTNRNNVLELNDCAAAGLNGSVWQNYFYNGSVWLNMDGLTPAQQADTLVTLARNLGNAAPGTNTRGCLAASNITMETFVQDFKNIPLTSMNPGSLSNCFGCHNAPATITLGKNSSSGSSPLYLSHIFRSHLSYSTGVSKSNIETLRLKEFIDLVAYKKAQTQK